MSKTIYDRHAQFYIDFVDRALTDENDTAVARVIRLYATEGFWQSGGTGVRGHMGAYHRKLSTLINELLAAALLLKGSRSLL